MAVDPTEPFSREEMYLASAAGQGVAVPECPWNRKEAYLADIGDRLDGIEEDVEALKNNPDVVDIVDTYADLQAYDKTKLTDNDIIRVLNDETHDGESTYYRYSASTQTFTYIGTTKQYTDFVGTDGTTAGEAGLVPAPATTDAGKFLKADGTWDDAGSAINVVQTTGTSTTDVMSQNATTNMVFDGDRVRIGRDATVASIYANDAIAIGRTARAGNSYSGAGAIAIGGMINVATSSTGSHTLAIGVGARATGNNYSIAIGSDAQATTNDAIAIGRGSRATRVGEVNIGTTNGSQYNGYNNSNYRLLTGVYDPQSDHDAATKGYVDGLVGDVEAALNAINNGGNA